MATRAAMPTLETLVDHMFDQVLEAPQRAELLQWIRAWEAANPDVDSAHRITGWIDVAYAFQARSDRLTAHDEGARRVSWSDDAFGWAAASA
jgi:hypothetical protein